MKAILYFDEGSMLVADFLPPHPERRERETQRELESRMVKAWNESQPRAIHKVVKMKLMRN